jgi:hypothetical protein
LAKTKSEPCIILNDEKEEIVTTSKVESAANQSGATATTTAAATIGEDKPVLVKFCDGIGREKTLPNELYGFYLLFCARWPLNWASKIGHPRSWLVHNAYLPQKQKTLLEALHFDKSFMLEALHL